MTSNREFVRTVLLVQTGMLALLTLEATLAAVVGIGSPIPVLLSAAVMVFVGDAARTGTLGKRLAWTERILIGTFVIDLAVWLFTALAVPELTAWTSRVLIPVFILKAVRRTREPDASKPVELDELVPA